MVVKIDKKSLTMVVDEQLEGSLDEISEGKCPPGGVVERGGDHELTL